MRNPRAAYSELVVILAPGSLVAVRRNHGPLYGVVAGRKPVRERHDHDLAVGRIECQLALRDLLLTTIQYRDLAEWEFDTLGEA